MSYAWRATVDARCALREAGAPWEERAHGSIWLKAPGSGVQVGAFRNGLVVIEGRLAPLLTGQSDDRRLFPVVALRDGAHAAVGLLDAHGITTEDPPRLRRCDLAADLRFASSASGLAFLRACAGVLNLGRLVQRPYKAPGDGQILGLEWVTPKLSRPRLRLYDAGRHHDGRPGYRIRLERELTDRRALGESLAGFLAADHAALYAGPLEAWLRVAPPMLVSQGRDVVARIAHLVDVGKITPAKALGLLGTVSALLDAPEILSDPERRNYRVRGLRAYGLHVDLAGGEPAKFDVVSALRLLTRAWEAS